MQFEQWHLYQLEAHVAKMVMLAEFMKLAVDRMDQMPFKIFLVLANIFLALGACGGYIACFWWRFVFYLCPMSLSLIHI